MFLVVTLIYSTIREQYKQYSGGRHTGMDKHVSVKRALRTEHFAADRACIWCRSHCDQVVWADVLCQVMVTGQQFVTHGACKRLLAVFASNRQYLHSSYLKLQG